MKPNKTVALVHALLHEQFKPRLTFKLRLTLTPFRTTRLWVITITQWYSWCSCSRDTLKSTIVPCVLSLTMELLWLAVMDVTNGFMGELQINEGKSLLVVCQMTGSRMVFFHVVSDFSKTREGTFKGKIWDSNKLDLSDLEKGDPNPNSSSKPPLEPNRL